ncbi:MAG: hypothetical protein M3451_03820 [Chloroflexota bacterium]|nr:hypothetical protein [Chloroflexota bacterium]
MGSGDDGRGPAARPLNAHRLDTLDEPGAADRIPVEIGTQLGTAPLTGKVVIAKVRQVKVVKPLPIFERPHLPWHRADPFQVPGGRTSWAWWVPRP